MKNKTIAGLIILILLVVAINFYTKDDEAEHYSEKNEEIDDLKQQNNRLKKDIEQIELRLENFMIAMVESEVFVEFLPNPNSTEILHKEINDKGFVVIYKDDNGITLGVYTKENKVSGHITIDEINPKEDINILVAVDYLNEELLYGGIITNNEIKTVFLSEVEAEIIQIDDELRVWYQTARSKDENVNLKALDGSGEVLFQR